MKALLAALALAALAFTPAAAGAQVIARLKPYDPAIVHVAGRAELYLPPDQARIRVSFYGLPGSIWKMHSSLLSSVVNEPALAPGRVSQAD